MSIPNLAQQMLTQDGKPHPEFVLMMQQLIVELQRVLSPEGYKLPEKTGVIITDHLNTQLSKAGIIYNSTTHKAMVNENGVYKTITTS